MVNGQRGGFSRADYRNLIRTIIEAGGSRYGIR
jgi:hypothetical protein